MKKASGKATYTTRCLITRTKKTQVLSTLNGNLTQFLDLTQTTPKKSSLTWHTSSSLREKFQSPYSRTTHSIFH